jgi:hypothetical protein
VDDMGMNSVTPWTTPRIKDWRKLTRTL